MNDNFSILLHWLLVAFTVFVWLVAIVYMWHNAQHRQTTENHTQNMVFFYEVDSFIAKLSQCESGGKQKTRIIDVNGLESIGEFQYQYALLSDWWLSRVGVQITYDEYVRIAQSSVAQHITKDILTTNYRGGIDNWRNCARIIAGNGV